MVLVTVVGEHQCKVGFEFVFGGPLAECRECKVRNVCFHLDPNRRYRVTDVRDVHHECRMHEGGVRVVEVERLPTKGALAKNAAVEGATITFEVNGCKSVGCPSYRLCRPHGAAEGMRFRIVEVGEELECPKGRSIRAVLLD
jgi:uncharacterized protein (UPF0179 family)